MDPNPVIDALVAARPALEAAGTRFTHLLYIGACMVTAGVVLEVVAFFAEIREETRSKVVEITESPRRHWLAPSHPPIWTKHRILEFVGAALVAIGVSVELYAEIRRGSVETDLRNNNSAVQTELQRIASEANKHTLDLAQKQGGLVNLVQEKSLEIDLLRLKLQAAITRADNAIGRLNTFASREETFENELAKDQVQLKNAESELTDFETAMLPRGFMYSYAFLQDLKKYEKTPVFISWTSDDSTGDSGMLGMSISNLFTPTHNARVTAGSFRDKREGIHIQYASPTWRPRAGETQLPSSDLTAKLTPDKAAVKLAKLLCNELSKSHLQVSLESESIAIPVDVNSHEFWDPNLPLNAVAIRVGPRHDLTHEKLMQGLGFPDSMIKTDHSVEGCGP